MASRPLDAFTKFLLGENGPAVVAWLSGQRPLRTELVLTEMVGARARTADHLLRAVLPGEDPVPRYFHIEIQTAGDLKMGYRALEYWVRAKRHFARVEKRPVPVSSFVVYLDRRQYRPDPGALEVSDGFGTMCRFRYTVLKLWEMDPQTVFRLESPALAPLAALMRTPDPVALVLESKQRILKAGPLEVSRETKASLLGALALLAGLVIEDPDLLHKILWEDAMGLERSVMAQDWMRRGREQGIEEGMQKGMQKGLQAGETRALRAALLFFLTSRFGKMQKQLESRIRKIDDAAVLKELVKRAAVVRGLEEFSREVPKKPG